MTWATWCFPFFTCLGCVAREMTSITAYVWFFVAKVLGHLCPSERCYLYFSGMTTEV